MTEDRKNKKSTFHSQRNIKYNLKRDKIDVRDHKYNGIAVTLPKSLDLIQSLTSQQQQPYDQGQVGSCTANASAFAFSYDEIKQKNTHLFMPSRLFIYYNTRIFCGDLHSDGGGTLRDAVKALVTYGACEETLWPYNENKVLIKPTSKCYIEGRRNKALKYAAVSQNLIALKTALYNGFPVIFGFQVYESFESEEVATTGIMPMPQEGENVIGGHAVTFVGYDDDKQMFKVRNSWGLSWGQDGYFWMPYEFAIDPNQCNDFWIVTSVSNSNIVPPNHSSK